MATEPITLQEAVVYFANPDNCLNYLVARRWPNGVTCPTCGSDRVGFLANQRRWQCSSRHPKRQFSVKVGTIFEDSPLGLEKWMPCVWLLTNCKNGVSSWEIHRDLGVTQKTAWFMLHRVRLAMQDENFGGKIGGEVEVDETFIGGKARNMHKERKRRYQKDGRNTGGKGIVMGMLEGGKNVRTAVIEERTKAVMQTIVRENVEPGAEVFSDEWASNDEYGHNVINHLQSYVDGRSEE